MPTKNKGMYGNSQGNEREPELPAFFRKQLGLYLIYYFNGISAVLRKIYLRQTAFFPRSNTRKLC